MSDVLDFVRDQAPDLKSVDDETLTAFVGEVFPQFLEDQQFSKRFQLVSEKQQIASQEVTTGSQLAEAYQEPFVELPKPEATPDDPLIKQVRVGLTRAGIGLAEAIETPLGVSLVASAGLPVVGKALGLSAGATFGAKGVLEGLRSISDRYKEGDYTGAAEALGNIVIGAGMLSGAARSVAKPGKGPTYGPGNLTPLTDASRKTVAQETTKSSEEVLPATEALISRKEGETLEAKTEAKGQEEVTAVPAEEPAATIQPPAQSTLEQKATLPAVSDSPIANARLVLDRPVKEPWSDTKHAVSIQVTATEWPLGSRKKITESLPESLRSQVDEINLYKGEIVPGGGKGFSTPARVQIVFKSKESAQEAIDYFKGSSEGPRPKEPSVPQPLPESTSFTPEALSTPKEQTLGIASPLGLTPTQLNRSAQTVVGFLRPRGHIPQEAYSRLQMRDSEIAAVDRDIAHSSRDLMDALKDKYGLSTVEMLGGGSKKIPVGDVELMTRYLKGDPNVSQHIPPEIRGPLDTMRAQIDGHSTKMLERLRADLATLPPNSSKAESLKTLIDKIESNMDVYVHRSYKFFDVKKAAPDWYAELPSVVRDTAENYLINNSPVPLAQVQARSLLLDWLADLRDAEYLSGGKLGAKDPSILLRRKVIPEELRDVLVEDKSPLVLYGKSVAKMGQWVANHKFLADVRRQGMGRWLFEEGQNPPGFNTKIAAESSESMSPLNGLRTTHEIAQAFSLLDKAPEHKGLAGVVAKTYYTLVAQTKIAATVQSFMTQARNLLSRPFMAIMAGHWDPRPAGEAVRNLWSDVAGSDKSRQAYIKSAYEYGVLGDTTRARELSDLVKDATLQDTSPAELYSWSIVKAAKKLGWTIPGEAYRLSDELGNLVGWENEVVSQRKINPTLSEAEIRAKSAAIVREIYPTYSETPEVVKFFRKVPLTGPFVTFPYQIVRTAFNSLMRGLAESRSGNSAERTVGYKRIAGVLVAVGASQGLMEMSKAMLGISGQEEEDFRRFQMPWDRNSRFLFYDKDPASGELSVINLSRLDPYSYMADPVMAVISGVRTDEPLDETLARSAKEFFRPWFSEQMLTGAIADSMRNVTPRGREVYNPTDETWEKSLKIGFHIGKTLMPGTVQRVERRIIPAFQDEQPSFGRKLEPGPEIARELTGVSIETFDFKNGLSSKASQFKRDDNDAEQVFRSAVTKAGSPSKQSLIDAYTEMDSRRLDAWKSMRADFLAALRRGVSIREARQILEARNLSLTEVNAISRGQYLPMQITPALRTRANELKRELPIAEINSLITSRRNINLD